MNLDARASTLARWFALAAGAYVIGYPFLQALHPPLTDLPFHAAQISIVRNYADPAFHFREQFVIDPLGAPYITMYGLGALLSLVLPIAWATKAAAASMLALVPLGLAVLFSGMKKSALLGVLGLALVWTDLAHWGFSSFIGAVGLEALSVGVALLLVDRPSPRLQLALAAALIGTFYTHVFRFPFAFASVIVAAGVMAQRGRALRPLVLPLVVSILPFAVWLVVRPPELARGLALGAPEWSRLKEVPELVVGSYRGAAEASERSIAVVMLAAVLALGVASAWLNRRAGAGGVRFGGRATMLVALLVTLRLGAFLTLPESAGAWWYIYQREAFTMALFALAFMPDLPRSGSQRLAAVIALGMATGRMGLFVATEWRDFHAASADFRDVQRLVPRAPKLFYLVYDHAGTNNRHSPFLHLPAWIQAEKGGWLGFHFAGWGIFPVRYREGVEAAVPPPLPRGWEWTPQHFRVLEHGAWFDTFLVRHNIDPSVLFAPDPAVRFVARRGDWWLYRRQ